MKNQSELIAKKPPTRIKTEVNLVNKRDVTSPSIEPKRKYTTNQNNNDTSLKKKQTYSPRNPYLGKAYANGKNEALDQVKKQLAALKTKAQQLNNDKSDQSDLTKIKSSSEYQLMNMKPSSPVHNEIPNLEVQQLKSRIAFYQKQVYDLQVKVIRLQNQVKQKENTKINIDQKVQTQKFTQISNLKQELVALGYRQRSLNDERSFLIQNQYKNQKKIQQLQLQLIRQRDSYQKSYKQAIDSFRKQRQQLQRGRQIIDQFRSQQRRLIDRHTEIIRQKQKQISILKDSQYEYRQKIQHLQSQMSKLRTKPFSSDFQKQVLKQQIRKLNHELNQRGSSKSTFNSEYQTMKSHLQKQISTNIRQIQILVQKNQQLQRQTHEQQKQIQENKSKYSRLEQSKNQQSRRLIELTLKYSKLEQEYFSRTFNNQSNVVKSTQVGSKVKYEDLHQQLAVKNNMIQKLHTTNKNLQNSLGSAQQTQRKMKQAEGLLQQSNNSIMRMKLQMLNRMFSNINLEK